MVTSDSKTSGIVVDGHGAAARGNCELTFNLEE